MECRQREPGEPARTVRPETRPDLNYGAGAVLACAFCLRPITTAGARIEVAGTHEHSFVNPHGFRYRIGCFDAATGCRVVGPPSTEWSWFPPCSWRIELCGNCREHLGWLFESPDQRFHGLILDRLVELDEG